MMNGFAARNFNDDLYYSHYSIQQIQIRVEQRVDTVGEPIRNIKAWSPATHSSQRGLAWQSQG